MSAWDKNTPVELSTYISDGKPIYYSASENSHEKNAPTMLDLFCGAGGFSVGAEWSGFMPVFGVDHLKPALETWKYNHSSSLACLGDIRKIDLEDLQLRLNAFGVSHINLITGGVPCQGFSRANRKHRDDDSRNFLFLEYMRFAEYFQPEYLVLENVSGMRSTAGGKYEKEIISAMDDIGYVVSVRLLNAADYGVPQSRQRLIFVGIRADKGFTYDFPQGEFVGAWRTVRDAISDLPSLNNGEQKCTYTRKKLSEYQQLMRGESKELPITKSNQLFNHIAPNHPQETIDRISSTKPGQPMYEKFKQRIRLTWDEPSPTQLAGGIRPQFQFGHPEQPRGLTIRERARIQSFPDSFVFCGGMVQERVQTGNAVPPLLVHNLLKPLYNDWRHSINK